MKLVSHLIADPTPIGLATTAVHMIASIIFLSPSLTHRTILDADASGGPQSKFSVIGLRAWLSVVRCEQTFSADFSLAMLAH